MCVILVSQNPIPGVAMLILHNRDEFRDRTFEKARIHEQDGVKRINGVDLSAGGTWLTIDQNGNFSAVLNIRLKKTHYEDDLKPDLSRGQLPLQAIGLGKLPLPIEDLKRYKPFNLVFGKAAGTQSVVSSITNRVRILSEKDFALSNHSAEKTCPKSERLKKEFRARLHKDSNTEELIHLGFQLLSEKDELPEDQLLETGISVGVEKRLSANFVHLDERAYQTVLSTVIVVEKIDHKPGKKKDYRIRYIEKNHLDSGAPLNRVEIGADSN